MKIKDYRADIDGLRAVAVIAVILYHAGVKSFSGGYVGVDVFFVISGFLITRLLLKDIKAGKFSILSFYERRIRRIFPAYFGLAVGVLLLGYWLYLDDDFLALTKSVFASTLSWANILFYSQAGYWDAASETKPMLHTWSLAVEEQFYVFYPIILFLTMRYARKYVLPVLTVIVVGSFTWSVIAVQQNPTAAFYLPHLRAWELIIGGLIAIRHIPLSKPLWNGTAAIGLLFILISVFLYTEDTLFPGLSALLPVLGSALIIHAGVSGESFVGKGLGLAPFTFIGKISYSLYLWHWPILVFGKYYLIRQPTPLEIAIMIALAFVLSIISWWIIESPFRNRAFLSRTQVFAVAGLVGAIFVSFNFVNIHYSGFPGRFADYYSSLAPNWEKTEMTNCRVTTKNLKPNGQVPLCNLGDDNNSNPEFLLWGDSHAMALADGLNVSAAKTVTSGTFVFSSGCLPSIEYIHRDKQEVKNCDLANNTAMQYLREHQEVKAVFLVARWNIYVKGGAKRLRKTGKVLPIKMKNAPDSATTNDQLFYLLLKDTISRTQEMGKQVFLVLDSPDIGYDVPDSNFIAYRTHQDVNQIIAPTYMEYEEFNQSVLAIFKRLENEFDNVEIIDPTTLLCPNQGRCLVSLDNTPLYRDDDHLSTFGAKYIEGLFVEPLSSLKLPAVSQLEPNNSTPENPEPDNSTAIDSNWNSRSITTKDCRITKNKVQPDGQVELCPLGEDYTSGPEFLLWGDSHARVIAEGLNEAAAKIGVKGVLSYTKGCFPSINFIHRNKEEVQNCTLANETAKKYIQDHQEVKDIFLVARWNLYLEGRLTDEGKFIKASPIKMKYAPNSADNNYEKFYLLLKDTISWIRELDKQVILVLDVPEIRFDILDESLFAFQTNQDPNKTIGPTYSDYTEFNQSVIQIFNRLDNEFDNVKILDPTVLLCPEQDICMVVLEYTPLYSDSNHLSTFGSKFIADMFIETLKELKNE